jgi:hypothetical protein
LHGKAISLSLSKNEVGAMFKEISLKVLPHIDQTIGELINFGKWTLYEIEENKKYLLKTDTGKYYLLAPDNIEQTTSDNWGKDIQAYSNKVFFSDVKMPPTIEEFCNTWD